MYIQILPEVQQQMMSSKVGDAICVISFFLTFLYFLFFFLPGTRFNFLVWKNYSSLMARKRIMTRHTLRQFKRIHMITTEWRVEPAEGEGRVDRGEWRAESGERSPWKKSGQ